MKDALLKRLKLRQGVAYVLIIILCLLNGLTLALLTHDRWLGLGDGSTFYSFARNISHGEAIYEDFIHFRTPGSYFLQAFFIKLFGEQQSSVTFAIRFETVVLYPLIFLLSAIIIFKSKRKPIYSLLALVGVAYLPPLIQLRAAFALLSIACYFASYEAKKHQKQWLFLAGLLCGVTFMFGQETALMAVICVVAGELVGKKRGREFWGRLKLLIGSAFLGALPLLLYVLFFSNFMNFVYYVTYYSFILQPKFMNTPFPGFGWTNMFYYLPFILYVLCFFILYGSSKLGKKEGILLSFGILRLITALGRSDEGHLIFAIPELFIIVPLFLSDLKHLRLSGKHALRFLPYGLGLVGLIALAITVNSIFLIAAPFLILWALTTKPPIASKKSPMWPAVLVGLITVISFGYFIHLLFPYYRATYRDLRAEYKLRHNPAYRIGGVKVKLDEYKEIVDVQNAVKDLKIRTIFAFPIQPFYYSLAPHHGSRYLTFEPQTTVKEQETTIKDLQASRPEVVILDPTQAEGLSGSLWKISDYITTHYEFHKQVLNKNMLWIMTPKDQPFREEYLIFQLFKENDSGSEVAKGVQNRDEKIINAIMQYDDMRFRVDNPRDGFLSLSVIKTRLLREQFADCGFVVIRYNSTDAHRSRVCMQDGQVKIPIKASTKPIELMFQKDGGEAVLWNEPKLTD